MNYLAASYEVSKTEKFGTQQAAGNQSLSALWRIESKQICLFVCSISGYQAKLPYT
jgi:hypothetical protein